METAYLDAIARCGLLALVVALLADWRFWRASAALSGLPRIALTVFAGYGTCVLAVIVYAAVFERSGRVSEQAMIAAIHGAILVQLAATFVLARYGFRGKPR